MGSGLRVDWLTWLNQLLLSSCSAWNMRTIDLVIMHPCRKCGGENELFPAYSRCRTCRNEATRAGRKHYRDFTPEEKKKANCRSHTKMLVKRGLLRRLPCERCGERKTQAHHLSYDDPRAVLWLCQRCHEDWHLEHDGQLVSPEAS